MKLLEQPIDEVGSVQRRAFTLVELLVTIGIVVVLVALQLPALAGAKQKTKMMVCVSNLHEIGVASSTYASEFDDYFPPTTIGIGNPVTSKTFDVITGIHYTRYILSSGFADGIPMPVKYLPPWNTASDGMSDENMGYLYVGRFIKDGHVFFCPSLSDVLPGSSDERWSPDYYSNPFMSTHSNGTIRSSYEYNPRQVNPTSNPARKYEKVSDQKSLDVFTIDYLAGQNGGTGTGAPFNPDNWVHYPAQGLTTLFTDGSAKFGKITDPVLFNGICNALISDESITSYIQYNTIFNSLVTSP